MRKFLNSARFLQMTWNYAVAEPKQTDRCLCFSVERLLNKTSNEFKNWGDWFHIIHHEVQRGIAMRHLISAEEHSLVVNGKCNSYRESKTKKGEINLHCYDFAYYKKGADLRRTKYRSRYRDFNQQELKPQEDLEWEIQCRLTGLTIERKHFLWTKVKTEKVESNIFTSNHLGMNFINQELNTENSQETLVSLQLSFESWAPHTGFGTKIPNFTL